MLLIERECRHCGAPLALFEVSKERFDAIKGVTTGRITNHRDDEHDFDINEVENVKLEYRKCSECCTLY